MDVGTNGCRNVYRRSIDLCARARALSGREVPDFDHDCGKNLYTTWEEFAARISSIWDLRSQACDLDRTSFFFSSGLSDAGVVMAMMMMMMMGFASSFMIRIRCSSSWVAL
jgi:hypothetical protein